eukprot:365377-Chlamydomonas_euryale.AAC.31
MKLGVLRPQRSSKRGATAGRRQWGAHMQPCLAQECCVAQAGIVAQHALLLAEQALQRAACLSPRWPTQRHEHVQRALQAAADTRESTPHEAGRADTREWASRPLV